MRHFSYRQCKERGKCKAYSYSKCKDRQCKGAGGSTSFKKLRRKRGCHRHQKVLQFGHQVEQAGIKVYMLPLLEKGD